MRWRGSDLWGGAEVAVGRMDRSEARYLQVPRAGGRVPGRVDGPCQGTRGKAATGCAWGKRQGVWGGQDEKWGPLQEMAPDQTPKGLTRLPLELRLLR